MEQVCLDRGIDCSTPRLLDANADHSHQHRGEDGDPAYDRQQTDFLQRPRQGADYGDDCANQSENDSASPMIRENVHHNRKGEDVTAHYKDVEDDLAGSEYLSEDGSAEDFACIGHVVYVWVGELEMAEHVASVSCDNA